MKFGYGKIGRSMPLTLEKCGNLGGDVEMIPVIKELALRNPNDEFYLVGRNSGENPVDVGLPKNVINPWIEWAPALRKQLNKHGFRNNFSIEEHRTIARLIDDITKDVFPELDEFVLWIGQHGTSNTPLPVIQKNKKAAFTKPHDSFAYYCSFLLRGVNTLRHRDPFKYEAVWLNADSRNYLKMRDLTWPLRHPVLTQMNYTHKLRHERGIESVDDPRINAFPGTEILDKNGHRIWQSEVTNVYSRLEINGLRPGTPFGDLISYSDDWNDRKSFGLFINEARAYVGDDVKRVNVMRDWVMPLNPDWVHGTWSDESQQVLGIKIQPAPWDQYYPRLHSVRSTFTTPSSGSGFATAKPWEAFAAGTVCFFHPRYDDQNNIMADAPEWLQSWLRVKNPTELRERVEAMNSDAQMWYDVVVAQRQHFDNALNDLTYINMIERRLYA